MHPGIMVMRSPKQAAYAAAGGGNAEAPISGTLAVSYPAGIVFGSFLLLHVFVQHSSAPSITTPTGWTLINSQTDSAAYRSSVFWRKADGTESGSIQVTCDGATFAAGRMYRMSGGGGVEASGGAYTAGSGTGMSAVDLTTLGSARLACQAFACSVSATTLGDISGESNADYTEAVAEYHSGLSGVMLQLQTAAVNAVAITGGSATLGTAGTQRIRHGFAITP